MARGKSTPELWDRLENESARAYEAFKIYMQLNPSQRTIPTAWREWTGNPEAEPSKISSTFRTWHSEHAWPDRAEARDAALDAARRRGEEKAIEREAEKQAASTERIRNRFQELMTMGYEAAMKTLEEAATEGGMSTREAVNVIKLHFEATRELASVQQNTEDDWTEEDDREFADPVVDQIQSGAEGEALEEDEPGEEEEGS